VSNHSAVVVLLHVGHVFGWNSEVWHTAELGAFPCAAGSYFVDVVAQLSLTVFVSIMTLYKHVTSHFGWLLVCCEPLVRTLAYDSQCAAAAASALTVRQCNAASAFTCNLPDSPFK
jgi:hypothetical protein